jgi:hypothetical protein
MDEIAFFIDESTLVKILSGVKADLEPLRKFLGVVDAVIDVRNDFIRIFCFSDVYSLNLQDGQNVAQVVFEGIQDGDLRDLLVRLQIALSSTEPCEEDNGVGYGSTGLVLAGAGALISTSELSDLPWWVPEAMELAPLASHIPTIIKALYLKHRMSLSALVSVALILFPNLYFHVPLVNLKNTGLDYDEIRATVVNHLAYLGEKAITDFRSLVQPREIIGSAGAYGVEISPESPNTHRNKDAMKERDIVIAGESICCEWHTKLDAQRGRIHFYAWLHPKSAVRQVIGNKVIVGIITDHLTT